jgi:formylmethanofuran dehydrogenase subunit E
MWKQVEDGSVRNIWKCSECDEEAAISPDFYALSGTPMCQDCDCNMAYVRTEVRG